MSKLSRDQRIELYTRRKGGESLRSLSDMYGIGISNVNYLVSLIDKHGEGVLRTDTNRYYSPEFKLEVINRILIDRESIKAVAIELGLGSDGMLHNWIKKYQENGYNVLEKKRGRVPMNKPKPTKALTVEEELEELKKKNQYLEAENEYLKKLNAVVKQRVEREKKKKPE